MRIRKLVLAVITVAALLAVSACTVNKQGQGNDEKVQIRTPVGGINVNTDANPQDVGLAVYPGAKLNPKPEGEHSSANVNISSSLFGVKVVAMEYVSDDPPAKLIDFYKKELGRYGNVLECRSGILEHGDALACRDKADPGSDKMELAVGTRERQHIVSVKPNGSGTRFGLVYVQTHGKGGEL